LGIPRLTFTVTGVLFEASLLDKENVAFDCLNAEPRDGAFIARDSGRGDAPWRALGAAKEVLEAATPRCYTNSAKVT
jgi:hypothetical protein